MISELNLLVVCFLVVVAVENDLSERNQIHSLSFDDNDPTLTLYHQQHVIMMMFSCSDGDDDDNNDDDDDEKVEARTYCCCYCCCVGTVRHIISFLL